MIDILKSIKEIYEKVLSQNHVDGYFANEAQLDQYFDQLYALGPVVIDNAEASFLINEVNRLNQLVAVMVQQAMNKLNQGQRAREYAQMSVDSAVFIDRRG